MPSGAYNRSYKFSQQLHRNRRDGWPGIVRYWTRLNDTEQRPHRVIISRVTDTRVLKRELSACRGDSLVAVTCRVETGTEASWRELLSRLTSSGKFFTIVDNGGTWTACRVYVIIAPLFVVWVSFRSLLLRMALTEQNWWSLHFPLKFPPISGRTWSLVGKFLQDVYIYIQSVQMKYRFDSFREQPNYF